MKRCCIVHPFLFAIFNILFLFSYRKNISELSIHVIILPLVVIVIVTFLLWFLVNFILKDKARTGLIVSLFLALFFSYGHVYISLDKVIGGIFPFYIGNFPAPLSLNRCLLLLWSAFLFLGTYLFIRTRENLDNLTKILNIVAAFLVMSSLLNMAAYGFKKRAILEAGITKEDAPVTTRDLAGIETLPDIYYIILDSHAGQSTFEDYYGYDAGEFLDYLRDRGFYVARKSCANYYFSYFSLAASLNMKYLNDLVDIAGGVDSEDYSIPFQMIIDNKVVKFLKERGYRFVLLPSHTFLPTTLNKNADYVLNFGIWLNEFTILLTETTMLRPFVTRYVRGGLRDNTLRNLSQLAKLPGRIKGPKFVFVHFDPPHAPFIFGPNGEARNENTLMPFDEQGKKGICQWKEKQSYWDQVVFIDREIKVVIDKILSESPVEPIIILQGDHGPGNWTPWNIDSENFIIEKHRILNAYYLPGEGKDLLYDSITPVNSFRLILSHYFDAEFDLLEDKTYLTKEALKKWNLYDTTDIARRDYRRE